MTYADEYNHGIDPEDLLVLGAEDLHSMLDGHELKVVDIVAKAYQYHARGESSLPNSLFLRFPGNEVDRIIALPAYLGGGAMQSAGIKWIASFPGNLDRGLDRASAVLILNSMATGRPKAVMEGSLISSRRTAASAALAARVLRGNRVASAGMVGCGVINLEVARFLNVTCPGLHTIYVYDVNESRAHQYREACESQLGEMRVIVTRNVNEVLANSTLISFATTAKEPYLHDFSMCDPGTVVLHLSLRDIDPEVILASDNIVDDGDHVCRAQTSLHLAEQKTGNRQFIRTTLGDILNGVSAPRRDEHSLVIFSPFGLGILDLALGEYLLDQASSKHVGFVIPSFFPRSWKRSASAIAAA
jgi:2,3-diaminopropionate biosynthesis protein SbnB